MPRILLDGPLAGQPVRRARKPHHCAWRDYGGVCLGSIPPGAEYVEGAEGADPFHPDRYCMAHFLTCRIGEATP